MYYYASKISAVAFCGTRCKQNSLHKTHNHEREKHCCLAKNQEEVITNKISEMVNLFLNGHQYQFQIFSIFLNFQNLTVDTSKDVNYTNRNIVSGPLDALIELLMPIKADQVDKVLIKFKLTHRF